MWSIEELDIILNMSFVRSSGERSVLVGSGKPARGVDSEMMIKDKAEEMLIKDEEKTRLKMERKNNDCLAEMWADRQTDMTSFHCELASRRWTQDRYVS